MKRLIVGAVTLAVAGGVVLPTADAGVEPEIDRVVAGPGMQHAPTVNKLGLAWDGIHNDHSNVYYKKFGGDRIKVNRSGTSGATGSLTGPHTLIYLQYSEKPGGGRNLMTFNTKTERRHRLGAAVNSPAFEYPAVASDRAILFGRCYPARSGQGCKRQALILHDSRHPRKVRTLIRDSSPRFVAAGFAGARYVAWTDCADVRCHIGYYNMNNHTFHTLGVRHKDIFAPWIDEETNQMYYAQNGAADHCGDDTTIRVTPLGENDGTLVSNLRPGWAALEGRMSLATTAGGGRKDLYITHVECTGRGDGAIYRLKDIP